MLEVQKYLKKSKFKNGRTEFENLTNDFGIKLNFHPDYPLVILNYCQINSPKMHPIVIECRGLVLDTTDYSVVASCMPRFFNIGEALEITSNFKWDRPINSLSKEDGSLMTLFWNNYSEKWEVKTRGSWANLPIGENLPKWDELFFSLLPKDFTFLKSKKFTFVFEMCSMFNQVVRQYIDPKLFLLTGIINTPEALVELSSKVVDEIAAFHSISRPEKIDITNIEAAKTYIKHLEETDGTAEGLVLQDVNGLRIKCKSGTYLAYSQLGGNGNIILNKNLVPLVLANEQDEAIAIFPHIEERVNEIKNKINSLYNDLDIAWANVHGIEDQKEFALTLQSCKTPLQSILFSMKKRGVIADGNLREEIRNNPELIIKVIGDN